MKSILKIVVGCLFVNQMLYVSLSANDDVSITDLKEVTYYLMEDTKKQKEELKKISDIINRDILPANHGISSYKISDKLLNYIDEHK